MQSPKSPRRIAGAAIVSTAALHPPTPTRARWALIAARKALGLTQDHFAAVLGVSRPIVSAIEQGKRDPTQTTMTKIMRRLGHFAVGYHDDETAQARLFAVTDMAAKLRTRRKRAPVGTHERSAIA